MVFVWNCIVNMDVFIVMGFLMVYFYFVVVFVGFFVGSFYFDIVVFILVFIMFGNYFEVCLKG